MKSYKYILTIIILIAIGHLVIKSQVSEKIENSIDESVSIEGGMSIDEKLHICEEQCHFHTEEIAVDKTDIECHIYNVNNDEIEASQITIVDELTIEILLYQSILEGDFSSIKDQDAKRNMEYLYSATLPNDNSVWQYLIHDFNNDGVDDLYIKLSDTYDSALFTYEDSSVKWIYIDALEMNCYRFPLKDGRFVEVYEYWTAPTTKVFEFDSDFNWVNISQYTKTEQADIILKLNEEYGIKEEYSSDQKYRYYMSTEYEKRAMDETEWSQFEEYVTEERFKLIDLDG